MKYRKHAMSSVILAEDRVHIFRGVEVHHYTLTRASRERLMTALHRARWLGIPCLHDGFVHFKRAQDCSDLYVFLDTIGIEPSAQNGVTTP